jgi:molybdate transport system substrate-binding protein
MRAFGRTISITAVLVSLTGMAAAADIRLLSVGAVQNAVRPLAADFSKDTGHKIVFTVGSPAVVAQKIKDGEIFDAVIVSEPAMDRLDKEGIVNPESRVRLANTGIGVAVRAGAPAPNLATPDAFKQALLAAKSVAYIDPASGGSSGIYVAGLLDKLGVADQVKPKTKLKHGGYVADLIVAGEAELGIHQISEIVPVKEVTLVGPLPAEIQNYTVYAAGLGTSAKDVEAAKALIKALTGPAAADVLKSRGMEPAGS